MTTLKNLLSDIIVLLLLLCTVDEFNHHNYEEARSLTFATIVVAIIGLVTNNYKMLYPYVIKLSSLFPSLYIYAEGIWISSLLFAFVALLSESLVLAKIGFTVFFIFGIVSVIKACNHEK